MINFEIGNIKYTWYENSSIYWFTSEEKKIKQGETRYLANKLFFATTGFESKKVKWAPIEKDYSDAKLTSCDGYDYIGANIQSSIRKDWFTQNILGLK